jgi:cobalt/nickel transport system permease protein
MDIRTVMHSLEYLHLSKNISLIFYLSYRYIHRYLDEMGKLKKAMILKGVTIRKMNLYVIGKIYANLLIRSYEDTDRIFKSMVLKGFLQSNKDSGITFKIRAFDIYLLIFTLIFVTSIITIDMLGISNIFGIFYKFGDFLCLI